MFSRFTQGRFRPLLPISAIYLVSSAILRVALWLAFGRSTDVAVAELAAGLPLGAVNDCIAMVYLLLPMTITLVFLPTRSMNNRLGRAGAWFWAVALLFGIFYLACAEFFFFQEFNARFNLVAVDYLIYPHEVFINIWESYHVVWFLAACGGCSLLLAMMLRRRLVRKNFPWMPFRRRLGFLAAHLATALLVTVLFSTDSLAIFDNRVANEIVANGISSLFRAFHTNDLNYIDYYPVLPDDRAFHLLREQFRRGERMLNTDDGHALTRAYPGHAGLGRVNVVVLVEESFGAQFVGAYGSNDGLTPNFDRLARQGLLFTNAFANGTRTVHGLGSIVTSLPPIPSEGMIKRPGSFPIANWGEVLRCEGYRTSFLYGGYGMFDSMNPFFRGNGFAISDRSDIAKVTFSNIWGVCDQDLLNHALHYFDQEFATGQPFFSVIMTTSNHSPFTFPAGIADVAPKDGGRNAGIRYADFALGQFMDQAREHSWYADTLFVLVADHDARVYGREQIPLRHYRIPLLLLAPGGRRQPGTVDTAVSQIDVAPTVMGLLGLPYQAPFYGQDALHAQAGELRPILLNHDHDVGLLLHDRLAVLGLKRQIACFRVGSDDDLAPVAIDQRLADLATAYFQTAFELFSDHSYQLHGGAIKLENGDQDETILRVFLPKHPRHRP